ncbi:DNA polymerase I [Desulfuromonas acetoxidans]|uniref:DNA polymerase I n=1 Tax=Desulfuromonas acetoxidans (strain DSM 684 / 11070) TaxID=281689 RepID=Q1JWJ8_DESA6|nr:DNA polymerase I [Desulfuromonas acetoxidans]EAT14570.1 DNA polymerase I [Desulfuromonas acetoxidans DSM 684]MBF0646285.1 DNA polymerase I [Desulfuromonas acetoxidans]NVD25715.1 DNA polymerase I [Desulfuromonas acetoxidans]NVE17011.1 DNA polymerase I [Desulfuromonas acetoxidans]
MSSAPRLFLIDGSSYIYRAYYAIRHLSTSQGMACNAVFGFTKMLLKVVRDHNPDQLAVIFDAKGPTFRKEIYSEYKANRSKMPEDLVPQIPLIKDVVAAFNIPALEMNGFEADDIIATLARQKSAAGMDVTVVTGDKDLMQVVSDKVCLLDTMKDKQSGLAEVAERFGGTPDKVIEVQALAGDSSDNVPGVPGIGEKTAKALIEEFGDVENLLAHVDQVKGKKRQENLREFADQARLSRQLVTLVDDMDLSGLPADFARCEQDREALSELFKTLEFQQLYDEFAVAEPHEQAEGDYVCVTETAELDAMVAALRQAEVISVDTETTSLNPLLAEVVGFCFAVEPGHGWYVPVGHCGGGAEEQLPRDEVVAQVQPLLEDATLAKVGQNLKYDALVLRRAGIALRGVVADTMLQSYLLYPAARSHGLDALAADHLGYKMISYSEVAGTGKKQIGFDEVALDVATRYAAEDADITLQLYQRFDAELDGTLRELFETVEMPLLQVLIDMEWWGVRVDRERLDALSAGFSTSIKQLEQQIYELAGEEFNINSPKQLGVILFEKLDLPHGKKTKTGWSTAVDVLKNLADKHDVVALILQYRSLAKLKGTYTDALPLLIHPDSGRIHTSFNQAVTATGRLSSSDPNLQNIPIRSEEGRAIREAFVPDAGQVLLAADYSQIELRVMAHMADEPILQESFRQGEDIHQRTASEIFSVFPDMVDSEMRRRAKTINFGVLYGMGAFSLAKDLGISNKEAKQYIDHYFERYPAVLEFIEQQKQFGREHLYVETLLGRRCAVSDINSKNGQVRSYAERNAVNYPVQGSAADIIKVAMVRIHQRLQDLQLKTRMVLQVHDELVFDVPKDEVDDVVALVVQEMEQAVELRVPLEVSLGRGANWREAH